MFAAGHSLALSGFWPGSFIHDNADNVSALVKVRQTYKDALIYGQQTYQPKTSNDDVLAYRYRGSTHQLITLVNISDSIDHTVTLTLQEEAPGATWTDPLAPLIVSEQANRLGPITVPKSGLRVLLKR